MHEACTALGTPITGGNVSLYNETRGEGIYPTPVLGIVGILDDVTKAVPAAFQTRGEAIVLLWPIPARRRARSRISRFRSSRADRCTVAASVHPRTRRRARRCVSEDAPLTDEIATAELKTFGSSEYAKVVLGGVWGSRHRSILKPRPTCTRCSSCLPIAS